jgi:hypothetical protein
VVFKNYFSFRIDAPRFGLRHRLVRFDLYIINQKLFLNRSGVVFFRAIKKELAISFFADCGLTGHRIGEEQSALRVPTL